MEIVVCVKQVPDTTEAKIDPVNNTLIRQEMPYIVNPFDKNAVEAALQLKEKFGGKVTLISMGPPQAKDALKECLAMGADEAILLTDHAFSGADTLATSYTIAQAIKKIGKIDLIMCGKQAIDGDTAQVGPEIAEHIGIPQVTCVSKIEFNGDLLRVEREHSEGYQIIEVKTPVLLTVTKNINDPRYPSVRDTMKANRKQIPEWTVNDLVVDINKIGIIGSPTQVFRVFTPKQRKQGVLIQEETAKSAVKVLIEKMTEAKIV